MSEHGESLLRRLRHVPIHIPIKFAGCTEVNVRPSDFVLPGARFRARTLIYAATISTAGVFAEPNKEQANADRDA